MNRKIISEYLKTLVFAVVATLVVGTALCFLLFASGRSLDTTMPQYLILNVNQYLSQSETGFSLEEEGMEQLDVHDLWLQIVDGDGAVVYAYHTDADIPDTYTNFELVNITLTSDRLPGYTVYASAYDSDAGEYTVLIGCSSSLVTKDSYNLSGNRVTVAMQCVVIFLVVAALAVAIASIAFSRKISTPIADMMDEIEAVSSGGELNVRTRKNLFSEVFERIRILRDKLAYNDRMRAEWISNISHDIKTPLSTIKGYGELLADADYAFAEAEVQQYAAEILKAEKTLEGLVDDLKISQSMIEGQVVLNREQVELGALIQDCIGKISPKLMGASEILLSPSEPVYLDCDRRYMGRCLLNIISNAFVHNPNTKIAVRINMAQENGHVIIRIGDNGKGMAPDEIDHAFERYYRGTSSEQVEGTGLGLAIAKETVAAHGGTIQIESSVGNGTTFIITL
ncbi:MAG: HAMP domain-containing histidine kinase [Lachnospiraceae bacterium]|nr:HAMP domain-containing histidine kinase [Lachnospiraceae bacterium]